MRPVYVMLITSLLLPLAALAQSHSNAPIMAVDHGTVVNAALPAAPTPSTSPAAAAAPATGFPETAISTVTPPAPPVPEKPPLTPAQARLWPRDTAEIFVRRCAQTRIKMVEPCRCVITQLMERMGHDEFLKLSQAGAAEKDPRYVAIRQQCATTPQRRQ